MDFLDKQKKREFRELDLLFRNYFKEWRTRINEERRDDFDRILDVIPTHHYLTAAACCAGGYFLFSENRELPERVKDAAMSCEAILILAIVLDDVIDQHTMRWGKPSIRTKISDNALVKAIFMFLEKNIEELKKIDLRTQEIVETDLVKVNAGEFLQDAAVGIVEVTKSAYSKFLPSFLREKGAVFAKKNNLLEMVGFNRQNCERIGIWKNTAFRTTPLKIGALLGGASKKELKLIDSIGEILSATCQYRDELRGILGTAGPESPFDLKRNIWGSLSCMLCKDLEIKQAIDLLMGQGEKDNKSVKKLQKLIREKGRERIVAEIEKKEEALEDLLDNFKKGNRDSVKGLNIIGFLFENEKKIMFKLLK